MAWQAEPTDGGRAAGCSTLKLGLALVERASNLQPTVGALVSQRASFYELLRACCAALRRGQRLLTLHARTEDYERAMALYQEASKIDETSQQAVHGALRSSARCVYGWFG